MARQGDNIHIPLPPNEALRLALMVKPTADMPRPGTNKTTKKNTTATKRRKKPAE